MVHRLALVAAVVALAAGVSGCSTSAPSATGDKGYVAGDGSVVLIPPADRERAPELSGSLVGGGTANLTSYQGSVVVVNVWAQWCGPCRAEAPHLVAAAKMLPDVTFLGINTKDNDDNALAFERSQQIPYRSFSDQDGRLVLAMQSVVNMAALPMTVVLDRQGSVAAAVYGPTTAITLKDIVQSLERES